MNYENLIKKSFKLVCLIKKIHNSFDHFWIKDKQSDSKFLNTKWRIRPNQKPSVVGWSGGEGWWVVDSRYPPAMGRIPKAWNIKDRAHLRGFEQIPVQWTWTGYRWMINFKQMIQELKMKKKQNSKRNYFFQKNFQKISSSYWFSEEGKKIIRLFKSYKI